MGRPVAGGGLNAGGKVDNKAKQAKIRSKYELRMLLIDNRPLIEWEEHGRLPMAIHCESA